MDSEYKQSSITTDNTRICNGILIYTSISISFILFASHFAFHIYTKQSPHWNFLSSKSLIYSPNVRHPLLAIPSLPVVLITYLLVSSFLIQKKNERTKENKELASQQFLL